ncbi:MAG: FAD-dependent oxidoreductase [Candidatus Omnitrophica bacterium]|nr:FAD-dependent oxidoreductase [Candidatus Omnitrophota bacterium]
MIKSSAEVIIVGSGAAGSTIAKELAGRGRKIIIIEKGKFAGYLGNEIRASAYYEGSPLLVRSKSGVMFHYTKNLGGSTVFSCGNAVRGSLDIFLRFGIDLRRELAETEEELSVMPVDKKLIGQKGTKDFYDAAINLGYKIDYMPKFMKKGMCSLCGKCVLGCPNNARWTAVDYVDFAIGKGALVEHAVVEKVIIKNNKAIGVLAKQGKKQVTIYADKIVLAAGGLNSPVILQKSGLSAGKKLFCDLFNVTYAVSLKDGMFRDLSMSLVDMEFFKNDGFIISPFMDPIILFLIIFNKFLPFYLLKYKNVVGIEVKIKDDMIGSVSSDGRIQKIVTADDSKKISKGVEIAKDILNHMPIDKRTINTTILRGAHPGGTSAIGEVVDCNLQTGVKGLYVCDASVLPEALGLPPIITLIALSKWFVKTQF